MKDKKGEITRSLELFPGILRGKRWKIFYPRRVIWSKWKDIVGEIIAENAWPWYFRGEDVLVVAVSNNIWMHQLSFERNIIIENINALLPKESHVSEIVFLIGDIEYVRFKTYPFGKKRGEGVGQKAHSAIPIPLSLKEKALLDSLNDQELKREFEKLLSNIKKKRPRA